MDAADSPDSHRPTDATAGMNGSDRPVGLDSGGPGPTEAAARRDGREPPSGPTLAAGERASDRPDGDGFILGAEGVSGAGPFAPPAEGHPGGAGPTVGLSPPEAPPADPTILKAVGQAAPAPRERPLPVIAGYAILGELGRGGMGVVYRARQIRLNRPCVLKMILAGAHAHAEAVARFLAEAEAVASLRHPNVVQIHHVGEADGLPFFELEYVEGGSLDARLDGTPWKARPAAELVEVLSRGVAEAHRRGIIHRDLKPANVLLTAEGVPKIADFGLAKSLASDSGLTRSDSILGSPSYMAPEQAEGRTKQVGPPADVYALGAILYELVSGRPPFQGVTVLETLEQVKATEPVSPSRLVPGLPKDVETIALKCLQKDPETRYESAGALAEDLRRFLGGEPIVARPVPAWERAVKWARRRPVIATLAVAVLVLLASLLGLGAWSYSEINRSLARAERLAETEARASAKALEQSQVAGRRAEDLALEDYINRVNRAYAEVLKDNIARAEDLLLGCPVGRRGWEWHYVNRLCHAERLSVEMPAGGVSALAFARDGHLIAAGSGGAPAQGRRGPTLGLWERPTGRRLSVPHDSENLVWSLAFRPDGAGLAVGGTNPQVEVRDVTSGEILWSKHDPRLPQAMSVAYSPDGRTLAAGFGLYSKDQTFRVALYDAATGEETGTLPGPKGGVNDLAFHPDGRRLAVAGSEVVDIWDVPAREKVGELRGHSRWIYALAYSPDGTWLATGGWDRTVKLRDAATGEERLTLFGHEGFVLDLAFSPDGRSLATTGEDRSVRLWEVPTGRQLGVFHGHSDFVQAVAFAPDGRELASGGLEGTIKVWDRRASLPVVFEGHTGWVGRLWYRRDGRRVVTAAVGSFKVPGETTKGWDPDTGEPDPALTGVDPARLVDDYVGPSEFPFWVPPPPATSPDGRLLARALLGAGGLPEQNRSRDYAHSAVEVLDVATGRLLHTLIGHTADLVGIAFSPDGRRIATASLDRTIKLWDPATGREVFTLRGHTAGVLALAFSPDGRRIVSGAIDFTGRVWDATPLPAEVLRDQEARHRRKHDALAGLARATEDFQRAEVLARSGRWGPAAAAFAEFVQQEPNNPELRYPLIRSLAEAGDRAGVRSACGDLFERFGRSFNSMVANSVAWSCLLTPDMGVDPEGPLRLAEDVHIGLLANSRSESFLTIGAALYRAGRFEDAIRRLDESVRATGGRGDPKASAFLAMAHHRLGHREQAGHWLDTLVADRPGGRAESFWDEVEIRILRREAEALILGNPPGPPTAAPAPTQPAGGPPGARPE